MASGLKLRPYLGKREQILDRSHQCNLPVHNDRILHSQPWHNLVKSMKRTNSLFTTDKA